MPSWYLYSDDGQHLGPVPTEYVARAVKSGAVAPDRWVTESDRTAWRPIREVREIQAFLEGGFPAPMRDREATVVAAADAFPSFAPAPSTLKDAPSSNDPPSSSDRTVIAPTAFDDETQAPHEGARAPAPAPAAGGGGVPPVYDYDDQEATIRARKNPMHDPFGATLRSPDSPGIVPRPPQGMVEPSAPPRPPAAGPAPAAAAPGANAPMAAPAQRISGPPQAMRTTDPPRPRTDPPRKRPQQQGGPVVAFFLGGLALGAIVVVAILVWAFKGGLLTR